MVINWYETMIDWSQMVSICSQMVINWSQMDNICSQLVLNCDYLLPNGYYLIPNGEYLLPNRKFGGTRAQSTHLIRAQKQLTTCVDCALFPRLGSAFFWVKKVHTSFVGVGKPRAVGMGGIIYGLGRSQ